MTNLPLGSFKRDEIYTFLGGLFVGVFWILFHSHFISPQFLNSDNSLVGIWFIFTWLSGTLLVYFINALCGIIQRLLNEKKLQALGVDELLKKLKFNITPPLYYSRQVYDESFIATHIDTVVFSALFLTALPFFLIKTICSLRETGCINLLFLRLTIFWLITILIMFLIVRRQWIEIYALSFLHTPHKELLFYDVEEVAKMAGSNFANFAIQEFNAKAQLRVSPVVTPSAPSAGGIGAQAMLIGLNDVVSQMMDQN